MKLNTFYYFSGSSQQNAREVTCLQTKMEIKSNTIQSTMVIIPSQMEVAPLHCTVDITQKRILFKNTKEIEKM